MRKIDQIDNAQALIHDTEHLVYALQTCIWELLNATKPIDPRDARLGAVVAVGSALEARFKNIWDEQDKSRLAENDTA